MTSLRNPRKWQYTWEALAHIPTLRLFLFTHELKLLHQCKNLDVSLIFEKSMLLVSWIEENENQIDGSFNFSLRVPIPKVLVDVGSLVDYKSMEDHIEVKLVLLLPVDHPLFMNFSSVLNISDKEADCRPSSFDLPQSLSVDSDLKWLSAQDGVHLFCKKCSMTLTKRPLRYFVEMPSADWPEVADNWFGTCCCSFGSISVKLVNRYANSYLFPEDTCLLDVSSVIVSYKDLVEDVFPDCSDQDKENDSASDPATEDVIIESLTASGTNSGQSLLSETQCKGTSANNKTTALLKMLDNTSAPDENLTFTSLEKERLNSCVESEKKNNAENSPSISPTLSDTTDNTAAVHRLSTNGWSHSCDDKPASLLSHDNGCCLHDTSVISSEDEEVTERTDPLKNEQSLLNISLGNGFMVRNSNISKDVDWIELSCPHCSSSLGAYPSTGNAHVPIDGGVRLYKCYTSTGLPVTGPGDIFRNHTLHRMFIHQLMEHAKDELSFRTVVRDLRTRLPMLQIVLLNSDAWSCSGYCLEAENIVTPVPEIDLHPVIKVLFSDCSNNTEAESRMLEEWATKHDVDEVFMLNHQVKILTESLKSAMSCLPLSCSSMQGLFLSSIER